MKNKCVACFENFDESSETFMFNQCIVHNSLRNSTAKEAKAGDTILYNFCRNAILIQFALGVTTFMSDDLKVENAGFPECRYVVLDEFRRLLGLTEFEFGCFLKAVGKSHMYMLDFSFGDLNISLNNLDDGKLRLGLDVKKNGVEKSAGYKFDLADLGFLRRQKKLHDFGEE